MKKRNCYKVDAGELIRVISTYQTLQVKQIYALFPNRAEIVEVLLKRFIQANRIFYDNIFDLVSYEKEIKPNIAIIKCFWVLLDFIEKIEFHTIADTPANICFFAQQELYEIVYVPKKKEIFMNHAFSCMVEKIESKRIVVIEQEEQIHKLHILNTVGYCKVLDSGKITYYQVKQEKI